MSQSIMGFRSALPFFIAPMALGRLAHPDGEICFVRGAAQKRIPYCASMLASVSHEVLTSCWKDEAHGHTSLFFQLYVAKEEHKAREMIRRAKTLGYKALVLTVDTPVVGKREEDERDKLQINYDLGLLPDDSSPVSGIEGEMPILRGVNSSTLNWEDLKWIREEWGNQGPIVLKGIGCAEDAKLAHLHGFEHLYLSNHGGRQIASAPSSIGTLIDIRHAYPEVIKNCKLYLDGGIRRGSDIVKALCLGATAVGVGRPFMYGLGAYGTAGVVKVIQSESSRLKRSEQTS
jgi:L-lactate dehydrogenase (cytochrome)